MVIEKAKRPLVPSQMGAHNRLRLLALAGLLIVGCSSSKPDLPKPVERDPCLDAGPASSVAFDSCVTKREARKQEALRALLDDGPSHEKAVVNIKIDEQICTHSISPAEELELPIVVVINWKFSPKTVMPTPADATRMKEMEKLLLPAVQDKGLARWICTTTYEHQREWHFFTRSAEDFSAQAREALGPTGPYPIELTIEGATR
ncbi:DUF695 domain-containing protein [Pseudomonas viciae]|uniref:DUF695 domain-containing protein n=1 Tax=Pseudomonas viciae TaxID=2505979 RepID=A0ABY8PGV1_9PSED|nr:DUF695 domain-containing protein [Pseudomonas viciae]UZE87444.1 DUF695 domain-containing protein [Pseudomonas viciae]WGO94410.1 DUF695 domain-containing protein [Pseudomonas viciae]